MKKLFIKFKNHFSKKIVKDERGQGMLEYILLVVVVVGLVVLLKPYLKDQVESIKTNLTTAIGQVTGG